MFLWKKINAKIASGLFWLTKFLFNCLFSTAIIKPCCRFEPSCSLYFYQAIKKYGMIKGFALTVGRLSRCHPFNKGGSDPV